MNYLLKIALGVVCLSLVLGLSLSEAGTRRKSIDHERSIRLSLRIAEARRDDRKSRYYRSLARRERNGSFRRP